MTNNEAIKILISGVRYRYVDSGYSTARDLAITALRRQDMENNDIGMFCPSCNTGIHKHVFKSDNSAIEISYCPFCGEKLQWENNE